jgi:Zn-dependent protease with chaperone function
VNEDRASRYHRRKRQASVGAVVWSIVLLALLLASGGSMLMREAAEAVSARLAPTAWQPSFAVLLYVVLLSAVNELGSLPLNFYSGYILEHRYELSTETVRGWLLDQLKAFGLGTVLGCGAAGVIYWFIRRSPDHWWLWAGCTFALMIIGLTNLAPVVLLPLFYPVKPLDRDALRSRLLALAERAGARVVGAYEMGFAGKTRKANAALAGIGTTRRILVSDTMLAEYSDDEIEVVLAHEMAHHVHGDIWKGILFESSLILAGFYCSAWLLRQFASAVGLRAVDDPAGLPLLLLAAGAISVAMMPVGHAISRTFERSADRFALRMTRNPSAFVSAMRRLAAQNLAEDQPSKIVQWLFYSHPPIRERIAAAERFDRLLKKPAT